MVQSPSSAARAACVGTALLGWALLGPGLFAFERVGPGPALGAGACELVIEGSRIARLTLEGRYGQIRHLANPGPRVSLPAGDYSVRQVELKGGYQFIGPSTPDPGRFTLTAQAPYRLKVGAPLTSDVKVARSGRFLTLDYQLLDAGGRAYRGGESVNRPRFTVYRGDREIGSGSFEYG
jgi:hypothetical protein